ncbi:LysE family translocator [Bacillus cytotoxicus]
MYIQVFLVGLLAPMSPGPDFFIVMKNSLDFGSRTGIATAIGIALALVIHITYTILGFTVILQKYPAVFIIIQLLGATYLIWLGWNAIRSTSKETNEITEDLKNEKISKNLFQAFKEGFLCNVLNPKSALFFLSIFSQFISTNTPDWIRWVYGVEIIFAVGLWFVVLATIISYGKFRLFYRRYSFWFDRFLGTVIILFALKIIFSVVKST